MNNWNLLWISFGLYVLYLILDFNNDSITMILLKVFGKINDDDSFDGEYSLKMPKKRLQIPDEFEDEISTIMEQNKDSFDNNMVCMNIMNMTFLEKQLSHLGKETKEYKRQFEARKKIRNTFARIVYKIVYFLRDTIERGRDRPNQGIEQREKQYQSRLNFMEEFQGDEKVQDGSKDEELDVIEEDPEEAGPLNRSRVFSRSNTNKASASEISNSENKKQDPSDSDNDAQSIRSFGSGFSRNKSVSLHTKSKAQSLKDPVKGEAENSKKDVPISILTWPKECGEKTLYVIFFPFYVIYWAIMPNLLYKPRISKVLMGILIGFLIFIGFAAILTFLQEDLIFNFKIKPNLFSLFNSLIYNISYPSLNASFLFYGVKVKELDSDFNFLLTIQEMSIFKFTILLFINYLVGAIAGGDPIDFVPALFIMLIFSIATVIFLQIFSILVDLVGGWKCCTGYIYFVIFLGFVGVNIVI